MAISVQKGKPVLRIGYYISELSMESGGAFTYAFGILRLLLASDKIAGIVLFYSKKQKHNLKEFFNNDKISGVKVKKGPVWNLRFSLAKKYYERYYITGKRKPSLAKLSNWINPFRSFFDSRKLDAVHFPFQTAPVYGIQTPLLITLHDVQELHFPEYFTSHQRLYRALNFKRALEEADQTIVSFNHVKEDLLKFFEIDESRISVCPAPLTDNWFSVSNYLSYEELAAKYKLPESYILYPAATWRHKNHLNLLKAISLIKEDMYLVCTGSITGFYDTIEHEVKALGLEDRVRFLGIVPEKDLIGLYHAARLVVIVTQYEAGSAPLFEAMRYGAPVICSNVTSLPESIGDDRFVFNPFNTKEMAALIEKACNDKEFRSANLKNSRERIEFYKQMDYTTPFLKAYSAAKSEYQKQ